MDQQPWPREVAEGAASGYTGLLSRYDRVGEGTGGVGRGSYGVVFIGEDKQTGELVAIKRQPRGCAVAVQELLVYRKLRPHPHPNVMALRDVFVATSPSTNASCLYTVFDFMDTTLSALAKFRRGVFLRSEASQLFRMMACGVANLHHAEIVHADLSAKNILINGSPPHWTLRVADFGSAYHAGTFLAPTEPVTTFSVMAPEVALGAAPAPPADVFALGVHGAGLFAGRFNIFGAAESTTVEELLAAHVRELGEPGRAYRDFVRRSLPGAARLPAKGNPVGKSAVDAVSVAPGEGASRFLASLLHWRPEERPQALDAAGRADYFATGAPAEGCPLPLPAPDAAGANPPAAAAAQAAAEKKNAEESAAC